MPEIQFRLEPNGQVFTTPNQQCRELLISSLFGEARAAQYHPEIALHDVRYVIARMQMQMEPINFAQAQELLGWVADIFQQPKPTFVLDTKGLRLNMVYLTTTLPTFHFKDLDYLWIITHLARELTRGFSIKEGFFSRDRFGQLLTHANWVTNPLSRRVYTWYVQAVERGFQRLPEHTCTNPEHARIMRDYSVRLNNTDVLAYQLADSISMMLGKGPCDQLRLDHPLWPVTMTMLNDADTHYAD